MKNGKGKKKVYKTAKELIDGFDTDGIIKTGSQRFGYMSIESDYDFAVDGKHHKDWISWFKSRGWKKVPFNKSDGYGGTINRKCTDTLDIWEKRFPDGKVQVVISKDFEKKKRIFEWLDRHPEIVAKYYKTRKQDRPKIWEYLHKQADEGNI